MLRTVRVSRERREPQLEARLRRAIDKLVMREQVLRRQAAGIEAQAAGVKCQIELLRAELSGLKGA